MLDRLASNSRMAHAIVDAEVNCTTSFVASVIHPEKVKAQICCPSIHQQLFKKENAFWNLNVSFFLSPTQSLTPFVFLIHNTPQL